MNRDTALAENAVEQAELLSWEDLGSRPAGRAFRQSLMELLARPGSFFRKMALSGGLHEPLAFFAVILTLAVVVGFPAALSYYGLAAPDPERVAPEVYQTYVLPVRWSGLLLVLLPLVVVAGGAATVLLGTLFHAGGKAFGTRNWEGSVSIYLYSASAALVPLLLALAVVFLVALAGYLIAIPWPASRGATVPLARWASLVLFPAGILAGLALFAADAAIGCTRAFDLDPMLGAAAGVSGMLLTAIVVAGSIWSFNRWGLGWGIAAVAAWACVATVIAAVCLVGARRAERSG
jgi:hypothetical protein